jgi:hypothetical protein
MTQKNFMEHFLSDVDSAESTQLMVNWELLGLIE